MIQHLYRAAYILCMRRFPPSIGPLTSVAYDTAPLPYSIHPVCEAVPTKSEMSWREEIGTVKHRIEKLTQKHEHNASAGSSRRVQKGRLSYGAEKDVVAMQGSEGSLVIRC